MKDKLTYDRAAHMVTITGFNEVGDKALDVLNEIADPKDFDNMRSFRKKEKNKSKSKRRG